MDNKLPWEEAAMAASSHAELSRQRETATTKEQQNALAPYEHRAFAREAVAEDPSLAVPIALATPLYQAAKLAGTQHSRSDPSIKQVTEAYKGIGEGLVASQRKPWEEAQEAAKGLIEDAKKLLPWEQAAQPKRQPEYTKNISPLNSGWDAINQKVRDEQPARNQLQLDTLRNELSKEKDSTNRESLKREIKRVEGTIGFPGMVEQGNIDLTKRPVVQNKDGSISTVRSIGVNIDGQEVLIPTVSPEGKILSDKDAISLYKKTGKHLGKFSSSDSSTVYAEKLHIEQEKMYRK